MLNRQWVDERIDDIDVLGEKQQNIIEIIHDSTEGISPADIASKTEASRRHVYDTLEQLLEAPWCHVTHTEGNNTGDRYSVERQADCIVKL